VNKVLNSLFIFLICVANFAFAAPVLTDEEKPILKMRQQQEVAPYAAIPSNDINKMEHKMLKHKHHKNNCVNKSHHTQ
jgi:hypothetical protein